MKKGSNTVDTTEQRVSIVLAETIRKTYAKKVGYCATDKDKFGRKNNQFFNKIDRLKLYVNAQAAFTFVFVYRKRLELSVIKTNRSFLLH